MTDDESGAGLFIFLTLPAVWQWSRLVRRTSSSVGVNLISQKRPFSQKRPMCCKDVDLVEPS